MPRLNKRTIGWSRGLRISGKTPAQEEAERVTRKDLKLELIQKAGGKCYMCGYDRSWAALQFHHRRREEKTIGVAHLLSRYYLAKEGNGRQRYKALLDEEISKCVLLCANCHIEITHPEWENENARYEDKMLRGIRHQLWYRRWLENQPREIAALLKSLWRCARFHHTNSESWFMPAKLRMVRPDLADMYDAQKVNS